MIPFFIVTTLLYWSLQVILPQAVETSFVFSSPKTLHLPCTAHVIPSLLVLLQVALFIWCIRDTYVSFFSGLPPQYSPLPEILFLASSSSLKHSIPVGYSFYFTLLIIICYCFTSLNVTLFISIIEHLYIFFYSCITYVLSLCSLDVGVLCCLVSGFT